MLSLQEPRKQKMLADGCVHGGHYTMEHKQVPEPVRMMYDPRRNPTQVGECQIYKISFFSRAYIPFHFELCFFLFNSNAKRDEKSQVVPQQQRER